MSNTNCLQGLRCPECGQGEHLKIAAMVTCHVTDEGSEAIGDHDWGFDSHTECPDCGFEGKLRAFRCEAVTPGEGV